MMVAMMVPAPLSLLVELLLQLAVPPLQLAVPPQLLLEFQVMRMSPRRRCQRMSVLSHPVLLPQALLLQLGSSSSQAPLQLRLA